MEFKWRKINKTINYSSIIYCLIKLNSNEIISGSFDKTIKIWNLKEEKCIKTLEGHTDGINNLIKLNSNEIASCSNDKTIKIWNLKNSKLIKTINYSSPIYCLLKLNS